MSKEYLGYAITGVASLLSIVSCIFIIILILRKEKLRSKRENIHVVILLSFYTLLCMSSLIPYHESISACKAQGILIQIFSLSGIIWTGYIALFRLYDTTSDKELKKYGIPLVFIILFAFFTAIFPYLYNEDDYQAGTTWCWYSGKSARIKVYTFLFFYAIAWTVILWIVFVFSYLIYFLKSNNVENRKFSFYKYFPMVLVLCFIPLTISRIIQSSNNEITAVTDDDFKGYFIFSAVIMRLLGFFNALIYGFNPHIKEEYRSHRTSVDSIEMKSIQDRV